MNYLQACEQLTQGKRVRRPQFAPGLAFFFSEGGLLLCDRKDRPHNEPVVVSLLTVSDMQATDWEIEMPKPEKKQELRTANM